MNKMAWAILGAVVGYAYGRWSMLWADIDEYHSLRMDFEEWFDKVGEL